jgi:4-oxalocrotonate tautomerase
VDEADRQLDNQTTGKERSMPFIDIKVIEGVFSAEEKRELVERVSEAVIAVEGEALRPTSRHCDRPLQPCSEPLGPQPSAAALAKPFQAAGLPQGACQLAAAI